MDADEILLKQEKLERAAMVAQGFSFVQQEIMMRQKAYREQLSMYLYFEKTMNGNAHDKVPLVTSQEIALNLATAYENLGKRSQAIDSLNRYLKLEYASINDTTAMKLMLAKLLFRSNNKIEAENILIPFILDFQKQTSCISISDAADAYYILGNNAIAS